MTDSPDPIDVEVGSRVRFLRKQRGLSQGALADALGLTFQQVQKYERGSNRVSASMLVKIARKLEVAASTLLGEGETEAVDESVYASMRVSGAVDMLNAYGRLSPEVRRAVLMLARTLGGVPVASLAK